MQVLLIQGLHFLFSLFNIVQLCYIIHGYRLERNYEENYYYEKREFHPVRNSLLLLLTATIWGVAFVAQSVSMDYIGRIYI